MKMFINMYKHHQIHKKPHMPRRREEVVRVAETQEIQFMALL